MIRKYAAHIIVACIFALIGASFGLYVCPNKSDILQSLTEDERRDIAIDFMAESGSWNNTLHDKHNFGPMDSDGPRHSVTNARRRRL